MSVYNGNPWVGDIYHWVLVLGIDFNRIVATTRYDDYLLTESILEDYRNDPERITLQEWFDRKQKEY